MPAEEVQPLRISKAVSSSTIKISGMPRPLSEVAPTERRRNSPSYNQATRKMLVSGDSSPFDHSPLSASTYALWKQREASPGGFGSENEQEHSPSPQRRSSIENLMRASRVKNSNMFAREHKQDYDPTSSPIVERPLAGGRSLNANIQSNAFGGQKYEGIQKHPSPVKGHKRTESTNNIPYSVSELSRETDASGDDPEPQAKIRGCPTKSSLSANGRFAYPAKVARAENLFVHREGEEHTVHTDIKQNCRIRHAKSVTFDAAPPQVNEYERPTPDPSSVASGSREGSYESADEFEDVHTNDESFTHEDSFDECLEDTDKTPVVLPEHWRHMSPAAANTDLAHTFDDPFEGNSTTHVYTGAVANESEVFRTNSTDSNGENRPLPPLPPSQRRSPMWNGSNQTPSFADQSGVVENLHSSLKTAETGEGVFGWGGSPMSLKNRLELLAMEPLGEESSFREVIPTVAKSDTPNKDSDMHIHEDPEENSALGDLQDYHPPARISRESILRKVRSRHFEDDGNHSASAVEEVLPEFLDYANLDPDVPIPSREASSNYENEEQAQEPSVLIKHEDNEHSEVDLYSIPEAYLPKEDSRSLRDSPMREESVVHHVLPPEEEDEYRREGEERPLSSQSYSEEHEKVQLDDVFEDRGPPTPTPQHFAVSKSMFDDARKDSQISLPGFASFLSDNEDFKEGFRSFISATSTSAPQQPQSQHASQRLPQPSKWLDVNPGLPDQELLPPHFSTSRSDSGAGTPDSVLNFSSPELQESHESPSVPAPVATIKAPGGKLKTRPSATPADLKAMITARRQVSGHGPPSLSDQGRGVFSPCEAQELDQSQEDHGEKETDGKVLRESLVLDVAVQGLSDGLGLGLDEEFDRIKETQKVVSHLFQVFACFSTDIYMRSQKGYLMRQNTKVVIATSRQASGEYEPTSLAAEGPTVSARGTKSRGHSPRKSSHSRAKSWTTEPWNGKTKRKSVRLSMNDAQMSQPAPPLPGQESAMSGLGTLDEAQLLTDLENEGEGAERGRLFVKVVAVKDLDLALPKHERSYFQLTLDNGLHCVTTSWLELGRSAAIGQEFELVVFNELEFQLTLQTKLKKPAPEPVFEPVSPVKSVRSQKSTSSFARVFYSPKKRKELERKHQEEEERLAQEALEAQQQIQAKRARREPTAWDLLHDIVAPDGSFARAYACLKTYEQDAFGRQYVVDVPLFNEWTVEDATIASSVRSKMGGVLRKPPYKIGKLELQLFYVPKPKGAKEEDMPKSMAACVKEMQEAESAVSRSWDGHLSQQGGDCPYWRRRFFKLTGSKLTAYHEATRQPRATINLAKATKLIDDRSSLTQKETSSRNGGRRKSAFAEEEEGYMFVEEGFRIRFANGETIDFYADDAASKDSWMKVLSEAIGKESREGGKWTDLVLATQRAGKTKGNKTPAPATAARPLSTHAHPTAPSAPPAQRAPTPPRQANEPASRGPRAGSQSAPNSPMKSVPMISVERRAASPQKFSGFRAPTPTTAKLMAAAAAPAPPPIDKSPRHLLQAPTFSRPGAADKSRDGSRRKRDAIRSMIF